MWSLLLCTRRQNLGWCENRSFSAEFELLPFKTTVLCSARGSCPSTDVAIWEWSMGDKLHAVVVIRFPSRGLCPSSSIGLWTRVYTSVEWSVGGWVFKRARSCRKDVLFLSYVTPRVGPLHSHGYRTCAAKWIHRNSFIKGMSGVGLPHVPLSIFASLRTHRGAYLSKTKCGAYRAVQFLCHAFSTHPVVSARFRAIF